MGDSWVDKKSKSDISGEDFLVEHTVKIHKDWLNRTRGIRILRSRIQRYNKVAINPPVVDIFSTVRGWIGLQNDI